MTYRDPSILEIMLADINGLMPNLANLVQSYRLLVGAAEELRRTPDISRSTFQKAAYRVDLSGAIIDYFLEILLCKVAFSSHFLAVTSGPVDLFRYLSEYTEEYWPARETAEQILQIELLRHYLIKSDLRWPLTIGPKLQPAPIPPEKQLYQLDSEVKTELTTDTKANLLTEVKTEIRRPHYRKGCRISKSKK